MSTFSPRSFIGLIVICTLVGLTIFSFAAYEARTPEIPPFHFWITSYDGGFYSYDGSGLTKIDVPTQNDLTALAWRHDHAYALVVGKNDTLIKYDGHSSVTIHTGLPSTTSFYSVSWNLDDSEALLVGSAGRVLRFDGQKATLIDDGLNDTIYAVSWNPKQNLALLAGDNGLLVQYDGLSFKRIDTTRVFPYKDPYILYTVAWNPAGTYALIAGSWATLFKYEGGVTMQIDMLQLFGNEVNDAHWIKAVEFNDFDGTALIVGHHGATILYDRGSLQRTRNYTTLSGSEDDLHHIGHFWAVEWIPGTKIAYGVGPIVDPANITIVENVGFVARISSMKVTLVIHGGVSALTGISNS